MNLLIQVEVDKEILWVVEEEAFSKVLVVVEEGVGQPRVQEVGVVVELKLPLK